MKNDSIFVPTIKNVAFRNICNSRNTMLQLLQPLQNLHRTQVKAFLISL